MNTVSAGRIDEIWGRLRCPTSGRAVWGSGLDSVPGPTAWNGTMLLVTHRTAPLGLLDMGLLGLALTLAYFWHVWKGLLGLGSNAYLQPDAARRPGARNRPLCFLLTGMGGLGPAAISGFSFLWLAIGMMYGMRARTPDKTATGASAQA
jgi:hypothetical protein